jgi:hypothetical protein
MPDRVPPLTQLGPRRARLDSMPAVQPWPQQYLGDLDIMLFRKAIRVGDDELRLFVVVPADGEFLQCVTTNGAPMWLVDDGTGNIAPLP